jgi:hypothetical protein
MSDDDAPVRVFEGEYSEDLFLKTLIESAGIEASPGNTGIRGGPRCLIYGKCSLRRSFGGRGVRNALVPFAR